MGSLLFPVAANIIMEDCKILAQSSCSSTLTSYQFRYVVYTFVFKPHVLLINNKICLPWSQNVLDLRRFLDVLLIRRSDGIFGHSVLTHTDRYLHAIFHHHLSKKIVINSQEYVAFWSRSRKNYPQGLNLTGINLKTSIVPSRLHKFPNLKLSTQLNSHIPKLIVHLSTRPLLTLLAF